jgi:CTD small phosphatase-like protein 2
LPKVKAPFLPPSESKSKYTLVLDLDETLIHFVDLQQQGQASFFRIRPFCMQFLEELSKIYEIVIFTAGM